MIGVIGLDVLAHLKGRATYLPLALLPALFAAHQLVETVVWWGAEGSVPSGVGSLATWVYLLFAFVVLPTYVPWAVWRIEPPGRRRQLVGAITAVGTGVSLVLLAAMLGGPVRVVAHDQYLAYSTSLRAGGLVVTLYVLATCGAFLVSGQPVIEGFGAVNLCAVAVLAVLTTTGFASLWCAWAAVTSAAFALYLRRTEPQAFTTAAAVG